MTSELHISPLDRTNKNKILTLLNFNQTPEVRPHRGIERIRTRYCRGWGSGKCEYTVLIGHIGQHCRGSEV